MFCTVFSVSLSQPPFSNSPSLTHHRGVAAVDPKQVHEPLDKSTSSTVVNYSSSRLQPAALIFTYFYALLPFSA